MEGLGVTFMEASAAGLPIIGTRHNGIPEVVAEGQTGLLVDEHDYDTMAEHITALARDSERRRAFGQAGMARAAERFTIDQMIQRVLTLHEAVAPTKAIKPGHLSRSRTPRVPTRQASSGSTSWDTQT